MSPSYLILHTKKRQILSLKIGSNSITHPAVEGILSVRQRQIQHAGRHKYKGDAAKDSFLVNSCNQPFVFTSAAAKESKQSEKEVQQPAIANAAKHAKETSQPPPLRPQHPPTITPPKNTPPKPLILSLCPLPKREESE